MTAETRTRHPWRLRASVIAAVVVGIAFAAPTAYAAWTAQATAKGSVSAGRVTATLSGDLASVLTNAQMTTTRSVTLTNTTAGTSTQPAQTSLSLAVASGDATLASSTTLVAWPTTAAAQCTPGAAVGPGSTRSTWAAGTTMSSSLSRGQSTTYCVRTTVGVGAGSATGTRSLVASASATVSVGSFSATPATISGVVSTSEIRTYIVAGDYWYTNSPSGQALCLDVTGGVNAAPGATLSTYACHSQTTSAYWNQQLTMVDVGGEYAVLTMRAPAGLVLQATGSRVTVEARVVGAVTQRWSTQWLATNTWRYVNLGTGMCLTAPASAGPLTMSACAGTTNQAFVLRGVGSVAAQDPDTDSVTTDELAVPGTSDGRALHDPSSSEPAESASDPAAPGPAETAEGTSPSDARVADEGLVDETEADDEAAQDDTSGPSASPATRYGPDLTEGATGD